MTEYISPYSSSRRWLRGNLHAHTCCSGFMDISESGPLFARFGYDFLAVTDHNMAPDEKQWRTWQEQAQLILVPGEENGATDHILEIGGHDVAQTPVDSFEGRAQALRENGGFVAACHPQQYGHGAANVRAAADQLHALEIFNGLREKRGCDEAANIALWDELLTAGARIWGIATDDFHFAFITPGHGWVCVQVAQEEKEVSWQTIVRQLKAGAFFATTSPAFEEIGLNGSILFVRARDPVDHLRVIGPRGHILHQVENSVMEWRTQPELTYFRVEAGCGVKRGWSQPFFPA